MCMHTRQEELRTVNDPTLAIETPVGKPLLPTLSGGSDRCAPNAEGRGPNPTPTHPPLGA